MIKFHTIIYCILTIYPYLCLMLYSELFSEFKRELASNNNETKSTDFSVLNLYRQLQVARTGNVNDVSKIMMQLTADQNKLVEQLLMQLEVIGLVKELLDMKVYYQINPDPRNNENKSLYAKTVLPRFKQHQKRKYIGINFGTRAKFPSGWTESRKKEARLKLIKKGYQMLVEG